MVQFIFKLGLETEVDCGSNMPLEWKIQDFQRVIIREHRAKEEAFKPGKKEGELIFTLPVGSDWRIEARLGAETLLWGGHLVATNNLVNPKAGTTIILCGLKTKLTSPPVLGFIHDVNANKQDNELSLNLMSSSLFFKIGTTLTGAGLLLFLANIAFDIGVAPKKVLGMSMFGSVLSMRMLHRGNYLGDGSDEPTKFSFG
jgi:hypothetical protein